MNPFINCKYEAIYNVLRNFKKDVTLLDYLCYFRLQNDDEILNVYPKNKIDFKEFLKIYKIQESASNKTTNLEKYLKDNLKDNNCITIKTDFYYQKFSKKYFQKIHKKHNIFVKNIEGENVKVIESEFADSEKYIEMTVNIRELEEWYNGYVLNYYENKKDLGNTLYLYKINNNIKIDDINFKKIFDTNIYITTMEENLKEIINYKNNVHNSISELKTYTNILNLKTKELEKVKKVSNDTSKIQKILLKQINILTQIQRLIIKKKDINIEIKKFIEYEKNFIDIVKTELKQNKIEILFRNSKGFEIIKEINKIRKFKSNMYDTYAYKEDKIIIDVNNNQNLMNAEHIKLDDLICFINSRIINLKKVFDINKEKIQKELTNNGFIVKHINKQKNSINGAVKDIEGEKYFFKILDLKNAKEELRGYLSLCGKMKISSIEKIIKYKNICIILYKYDESIQKNKGLLNDFLVENDFYKNFNKEQYEVIHKVLDENLRWISNNSLEEKYPMQKFFNERVNERLIIWYNEDNYIEFKNKKYRLLDFVIETKNYFNKNIKVKCFLSQGDPNALNFGIKPIAFDYTTSGYNAIIAEFSTIFWSVLFNDLYYAPKYHRNSYYNHEKVIQNLKLCKLNIKYDITNNNINIISGKIKTTKIRKIFMKEYIKILKANDVQIHKDFIYFIIMRILCIFNLNEMEEKDKIYSFLIMITLFKIIKDLKEENIINEIEKFINDLGEF